MAFLITVPTALAIFFAIFILVCVESVFKKLLRLFSLVIWICLVAMGYLFMCFGGTVSPWDQVRCRNAFCVLICDIPGSVHLAPDCKQRLRRPSSEIAGPRGSAEWSHLVPVLTHQTCRRSGAARAHLVTCFQWLRLPLQLAPRLSTSFSSSPLTLPLFWNPLGWAPLSVPWSRKDWTWTVCSGTGSPDLVSTWWCHNSRETRHSHVEPGRLLV